MNAWFFAGPEELKAGLIRIAGEEYRHIVAARRLGVGDQVCLFDGAGRFGPGAIRSCDRQEVVVDVQSVEYRPRDSALDVTLAVAMPKGRRQDQLVEKCTELGVSAIWPMGCVRSIARPKANSLKKWQRTAIEACKQSGRCWVPKLSPPQPLAEIVERSREFDLALLGDCRGSPIISQVTRQLTSILLMIGPEGGFTAEELASSEDHGVQLVRLAEVVLRTETAAIAALAQLIAAALARGR